MDAWWNEVWLTLLQEFSDIGDAKQVTRVTVLVQGIVAGISFLGAGTLLKGHGDDTSHVKGLTTAAGLWMTAAIGISAGMGREATAVLSTLLALIILALMPKLASYILPAEKDDSGDDPRA